MRLLKQFIKWLLDSDDEGDGGFRATVVNIEDIIREKRAFYLAKYSKKDIFKHQPVGNEA